LIDSQVQASASYRQWQPFGQVPAYKDQVPAYKDDDVEMFESGAIVLHIVAKSEALTPSDEAGRARVASWVIAALNSIEPHAQNLIHFDGEIWANEI
jgi:glutathione S-transferase